MEQKRLYEALAERFVQGLVRAPMSPSLIKYFMRFFPGEEAKIGLKLPSESRTLSGLEELFPDKVEYLEEILDRMTQRGTVFSDQPSGEEKRYSAFGSLLSLAETPFWSSKETEEAPNWGSCGSVTVKSRWGKNWRDRCCCYHPSRQRPASAGTC